MLGKVQASFPYQSDYLVQQQMELAAVPNPGYIFVGWTRSGWDGVYTETTRDISFTLTRDEDITATFESVLYQIDTSVIPEGGGTVAVNPASQDGHGYIVNSQVKLTANPAPGYVFTEWQGDVHGNKKSITVSLDKNLAATAVFELRTGLPSNILVSILVATLVVILLVSYYLMKKVRAHDKQSSNKKP